jgi:misacylated tRNA(Ala) deacylase
MATTARLYWEDAYRSEFAATVLDCSDGWCALSATAFYPGGGGQPADTGVLQTASDEGAVTAVRSAEGLVWHHTALPLATGDRVTGRLDWPRRYQLMKYHTLLHVVNTVMLDSHGARITGADIGVAQARIDFDVEAPLREASAAVEAAVNAVIARSLALEAAFVPEAELTRNPRLIRTLEVAPPVENGQVRTLQIAGFDTQACGGTHVHNTSELGPCRIVRIDNKGRRNKRLYVVLEPPGG